jgi:dolichol-phosphate mannosyltransferase
MTVAASQLGRSIAEREQSRPFLSVIAPAHNEAESVEALVQEIAAALDAVGHEFEIVIVDDGSTDDTLARLRMLQGVEQRLRVLRMADTPPGRGHGQSAAFHAAIRAARGEILAMLDADLQNDPADIPPMLSAMLEHQADLVQGDRSHARRDSAMKRASSAVSRWIRLALLGDSIRDTGCSLRLMRREVALELPLMFRGQHRYIPFTARSLGYRVVETRVNHRPRVAGRTKYGVLDRAMAGAVDILVVRWMRRRRRPVRFEEIERGEHPSL